MTSFGRFLAAAAPLGAAALMLATAGCSIFDTTPPAPAAARAPVVIDRPGAAVVRVTDDNVGASIVLQPGQQLSVTLPLRITSGQDWVPVALKPGVLAVQGSKYEPSRRAAEYDALVGYTTWLLKAEAAGTVKLSFDLRRPRDAEPARSVTFDVSVK